MSELKFASVNEALQHLADLTGKCIKVAFAKPSEEDYEWANNYLNEGKKINYNNYLFLDVTGRFGEYFTLWRFIQGPHGIKLNYKKNVATDFKRAIESLKKDFSNQYIEIYTDKNELPHTRNEFDFPFGKYRNENMFDVKNKDPKYIGWFGARSKEEGMSDFINGEVVKNPYNGRFVRRKLSDKQETFIQNFKEMYEAYDLERHGVTKENKEERSTENKSKFNDLLEALKKSALNSSSNFVNDFIKKIENGADPTTFSDKVINILAKIYSEQFDKSERGKKFSEMYARLTGKDIEEVKESEFEESGKYKRELEFIGSDQRRTPYGITNIYSFKDEKGNKYNSMTSKSFNFDSGKKYNIQFIFKQIGNINKDGSKLYYIKNIKVASLLRFASTNEALQYLANVTGKRVKVAVTMEDKFQEADEYEKGEKAYMKRKYGEPIKLDTNKSFSDLEDEINAAFKDYSYWGMAGKPTFEVDGMEIKGTLKEILSEVQNII